MANKSVKNLPIRFKKAEDYKSLSNTNALLFAEYLKRIGGYIQLTPYLTNKTKVTLLHTVCGKEFDTKPNSVTCKGKERRCPHCAADKRASVLNTFKPKNTFEQIKSVIESEDGYKLVSKAYVSNKDMLDIFHEVCETTYPVRYNDFQQGYRCPECAKNKCTSLAVLEIEKFLKYNDIEFIREVTFEGLRNIRPLYYDFQIFIDKAENDYILLEYHGKQHKYVSKQSAWYKNFEVAKQRDAMKEKFAKDNGLRLLVITHEQNHIDVLYEYLNEFVSE
jgi:hypothetical protein